MNKRKLAPTSLAALSCALLLSNPLLCLAETTTEPVKNLPRQAYLPQPFAQKIALAALKKCGIDGYRVSVTVVDRAGVPQVQLRADGAGSHTINSSARKAYTAASLSQSTQHLAKLISENPELQGLRDMDDQILLLAGGLPLKLGDETVGGIGVGGAPGGHLDEICAQAGVDSVFAAPAAGP